MVGLWQGKACKEIQDGLARQKRPWHGKMAKSKARCDNLVKVEFLDCEAMWKLVNVNVIKISFRMKK